MIGALLRPEQDSAKGIVPQPSGLGWLGDEASMRRVLNDAISLYFADATLASASMARWRVGSKVETVGGVFQVRDDSRHRGAGRGCTGRHEGNEAFETGEAASHCSIREANPCQPSTRRRERRPGEAGGWQSRAELAPGPPPFFTPARRNSETDEVLRGAKQHRSGCLRGR